MKFYGDIPVWGDPVDEGALAQAQVCLRTAKHVAMMADHHLGYAVPIGGVVSYEGAISPSGVGYDIGCGNKAVRLDIPAHYVTENLPAIMDAIVSQISFGMGRTNDTPVDHPILDRSEARWNHPAVLPLKRMAADQLGTVGGGNHYVDIFMDELQRIWVGVHFGSRGLGHKTATWFLKQGGAKDAINAEPLVLPLASALGAEYLQCMTLAGEYAYAGRDWVCAKVAEIIGAEIVEEVHNHHNFAWPEEHFGQSLIVVRKGATPMWPGQRGFIGGSMGDPAFIVRGFDPFTMAAKRDQLLSLYSAPHGAGRLMSRTAAKGKFVKDANGKKQRMPGLVRHDAWAKWMEDAGVELRGGDLDEAPQAYKRIEEVLAHHTYMQIDHSLRPIGVAMAGRDVVDPFKD
jgi:tRNA-splicing ligase RtcB